jgi:hypothetical protein
LGKGVDKYGYVRPEEEDVVRELRKVWEPATVSKEEVDRLKNQIHELKKGFGDFFAFVAFSLSHFRAASLGGSIREPRSRSSCRMSSTILLGTVIGHWPHHCGCVDGKVRVTNGRPSDVLRSYLTHNLKT